MNAEIFAEWQRRLGHQVVRTASSFWLKAGPRIFQAFPYHWLIEPDPEEFRQLFYHHKALGIRYSAKWEALKGAASYHTVFEKPEFPLGTLPKKARYDVQKGLKAGQVQPIPFSRLAQEGWELRCDTLKRHGRETALTQASWERLCLRAEGLPGFESWGTLVDGELAAALLAFTCADCCSILYQLSRTNHLHLCVNHALVFVFTNEVLKRPEKPWLFYGLHSLDAPASVDHFKFRMGYTAKPVCQRVVFHPAWAPFFNSTSHALLKLLLRLQPNNASLAKTKGMIHLWLQGMMPIDRQPLPTPLEIKKHGAFQIRAGKANFKVSQSLPSGSIRFEIRKARASEIDCLTELHMAIFKPEENIPVLLGRQYVRATYRWLVTGKEAYALVASVQDKIVGLQAVADKSFDKPLFKACFLEFLWSLALKPPLVFNRRLWRRLVWSERYSGGEGRRIAHHPGVGHLTVGMVQKEFRGRGIFSALVNAAKVESQSRGSRALRTGIYKGNLPSRKAFEKLGWIETPELETIDLVSYMAYLDPNFAKELRAHMEKHR